MVPHNSQPQSGQCRAPQLITISLFLSFTSLSFSPITPSVFSAPSLFLLSPLPFPTPPLPSCLPLITVSFSPSLVTHHSHHLCRCAAEHQCNLSHILLCLLTLMDSKDYNSVSDCTDWDQHCAYHVFVTPRRNLQILYSDGEMRTRGIFPCATWRKSKCELLQSQVILMLRKQRIFSKMLYRIILVDFPKGQFFSSSQQWCNLGRILWILTLLRHYYK